MYARKRPMPLCVYTLWFWGIIVCDCVHGNLHIPYTLYHALYPPTLLYIGWRERDKNTSQKLVNVCDKKVISCEICGEFCSSSEKKLEQFSGKKGTYTKYCCYKNSRCYEFLIYIFFKCAKKFLSKREEIFFYENYSFSV